MSLRGRVALHGGLLAAGVGLSLAVRPGLLDEPNVGEWAVSVLGGIALLYAGVPLYHRLAEDREHAPGPDPESTPDLPTPGEDVDDLLAAAAGVDPRTERHRLRLRRRLGDVAVDAVRRREGCDAETAREMIDAGTWTADPVAASYLDDGPVDVDDADDPLQERLRLRLSAPARRAYAARRVADEVADLTDPGRRR